MIASGEKKEEYREIKTHWSRIFEPGIKIKDKIYDPSDVTICFSNGFSKNRKQMLVECKYLSTKAGKPEWGAVVNQCYYVLTLGKVELLN